MGLLRRNGPDPEEFRQEGLLHAETAWGTLTYRNYRGPGRRATLEKKLVRWTVAVTRWRLLVRLGRSPMVNVPWTDQRISTLEFTLDGDRLLIVADEAVFRDDSSGTIEVRVRCADSASVLELLRTLRENAGPR